MIFIDFEDASNSAAIPNCDALLEYVDINRKRAHAMFFLMKCSVWMGGQMPAAHCV